MSVDDMITRVEGLIDDVEGIPEDFAQSIIAVLRAAEQMRLTAQQMAEDLYELSTPFEVALETWDAAVKGEES